jgi:membrane fusion protein (multidrug efflux system)
MWREMSVMRNVLKWVFRSTLLIAGPVAITIAGLWFYMSSGRYVTSENAYVKSELIIITAEVTGRVTDVQVTNNQPVSEGQVLFQLDRRRFEVERDRRAADLGAARQRVAALQARHKTKLAELAAAESDAAFQRDELERSERLRANGTISEFRMIEMRRETSNTETRLEVIRQEIDEVLAEIGIASDAPIDTHPDVQRAIADLERAEIDLEATIVRAPADAITANLSLQAGEYVEEGDPVLSLVGAGQPWIEANLKETDLTHLREGQIATLSVDAYPDFEWTGRVASLSPATGAEYALLPPQNATGNWVKVVQRVPVRLVIDPLPDAPALRAGMSVAVSIDTRFERPLPEVLSTAKAWILPEDTE